MSFLRLSGLTLALAATLAFMVSVADARVSSGGSRGNRTFNTPATTNTAPNAAKPIERSMTQPGTAMSGTRAPAPAAAPMASRFGGGFGGLLLGGLLGAGLFGLLSGAGLFGGLSGLASFLGLMLQVALIAGVVFLIVSFFRNRSQQQPALAGASGGSNRPGSLRDTLSNYRQGLGGIGGGAPSAELTIGQADFDAFERLLADIQTAYAREDIDALGDRTTPEMLSYFSRDLADAKRDGIRNETSDVKLLQGDLSESWQEEGTDYATVAMRFSMIDVTVKRDTGEVVSGSRTVPNEVTEVWTFRRDHRDMAEGWKLSAVQTTD
jgi:predicted lipid-binding transport protein (Tim44 family)